MFAIRMYENGGFARSFKLPFAFFMGFFPVLYSWFYALYPFESFGFTPFQGVAIVILAIAGISLYHSVLISLIFKLSAFFPKKRFIFPLGLAAIFVFYEWFLSIGPLSFSWGLVSVSQTGNLPLLQTASLFGSSFITLIVVAFCGFLAIGLKDRSVAFIKTAVSVILLPTLVGCVLLCIPVTNQTEQKVACIQGNVLSNEKWNDAKLSDIINLYIDLTKQAAEGGAKIIVLPESAFPTAFTKNGVIHTSLAAVCREYQCTVYTGALIFDKENQKHNASIAVLPDGSLSNYYTKRMLVPFGETLPFKPAVDLFFDIMGIKFSRVLYVEGDSTDIIALPDGVNAGNLICFDSIFPPLSLYSVRDGANLMLLVTNDSWYEDSPAVYQHVSHAVLRAVETGRYVVRSANTGVSCVITPKGAITSSTLPMVEDVLYDTVYTVETRTLYSYIGDISLYLSLTFIVVSLLYHSYIIIKKRIVYGKNQAV